MAQSMNDQLTCPRCSRRFTQKSSRDRHAKRCHLGVRAPSRQKSCSSCVKAKVRCDLSRPRCGRCVSRSLRCEFVNDEKPSASTSVSEDSRRVSRQGSHEQLCGNQYYQPETFSTAREIATAPGSETSCEAIMKSGLLGLFWSQTPLELSAYDPHKLSLSEKRRQELLGGPVCQFNYSAAARHTARFGLRTVRSWARRMAIHGITHLPPMMHRIQFVNGTPAPLTNCLTLLGMWEASHPGSEQMVHDTIMAEIKRIIGTHPLDGPEDLLADCQALLLLMIVLFLGFGKNVHRDKQDPADGEIMVASWCLREKLAITGLFSEAEATHTLPPSWQSWAFIAAKRRTIFAMHHLEWAWSLLYGYPILTCFDVGALPAPDAGHLWREQDEEKWKQQYRDWLHLWRDGPYRMYEFFHIKQDAALDERAERWYAEADDFGMMLIAEVNATLETGATS